MEKIYLTNSPIVIPSETIDYAVKKINSKQAYYILETRGFTSAIGHQGTVDVLKTLFSTLSDRIKFNRIEITEPVEQIVFKIKGRLPEGKILTVDEISSIGYEFWHLTPVSKDKPC